ncbi:MAG: glutathione S-transferase family protein [Pseudohongiellaceae bacterium]|nr:glutathione S-transferase family protein [Pseudohongiellaceae bacterium]
MYTIYGTASFNAMKIVAVAQELGLDYNFKYLNLAKGENQTPEHLKRHPWGKIPVLEHDGMTLFESEAICRYLARVNDNALYSADPKQAARIDQMMDTFNTHIGKWMATFFWEELVCPIHLGRPANEETIAEAREWLDKQLPYIDQTLADNTYLGGSDFSIADPFAYAYFQIHESTSIDLSAFPNIQRWYEQVSSRPAMKAADKIVYISKKAA